MILVVYIALYTLHTRHTRHTRHIKCDKNVSLHILKAQTCGWSPHQLHQLCGMTLSILNSELCEDSSIQGWKWYELSSITCWEISVRAFERDHFSAMMPNRHPKRCKWEIRKATSGSPVAHQWVFRYKSFWQSGLLALRNGVNLATALHRIARRCVENEALGAENSKNVNPGVITPEAVELKGYQLSIPLWLLEEYPPNSSTMVSSSW